MNEQAILDGYTTAEFEKELKKYMDEINTELVEVDAGEYYCRMISKGSDCLEIKKLYCELSDWFADDICTDIGAYQDQEHIFSTRIKILLSINGDRCHWTFIPTTDKPEWQE